MIPNANEHLSTRDVKQRIMPVVRMVSRIDMQAQRIIVALDCWETILTATRVDSVLDGTMDHRTCLRSSFQPWMQEVGACMPVSPICIRMNTQGTYAELVYTA